MPARLATEKDLNWLIGYDGDLGEELAKLFIKRQQIFVAEEEGRCLAFLRLEYLSQRHPFIGEIQIYKSARDKDWGRELLEALIPFLKAKGINHLLCLSNADKEAPLQWYEDMNFKPAGDLGDLDKDGVSELVFVKKF